MSDLYQTISVEIKYILVVLCKTVVSPVPMHWRYHSLALRPPWRPLHNLCFREDSNQVWRSLTCVEFSAHHTPTPYIIHIIGHQLLGIHTGPHWLGFPWTLLCRKNAIHKLKIELTHYTLTWMQQAEKEGIALLYLRFSFASYLKYTLYHY